MFPHHTAQQEIATSLTLLAMTVVVGGWLRRFEQNDKLKFERYDSHKKKPTPKGGLESFGN